jgi:hypothetical protein
LPVVSNAAIRPLPTLLSVWGGAIKKSLRASEQDREDVKLKRWMWNKQQPSMEFKRFVFIDESCAKTNMTRLYGRAKNETRVVIPLLEVKLKFLNKPGCCKRRSKIIFLGATKIYYPLTI